MYGTLRTGCRPLRSKGATPASAAACGWPAAPSSGVSAHSTAAVAAPQPGTDRMIAERRFRHSSLRIRAAILMSRSAMSPASISIDRCMLFAASSKYSREAFRRASRQSGRLRRAASRSASCFSVSALGSVTSPSCRRANTPAPRHPRDRSWPRCRSNPRSCTYGAG